jgi:ABC-type antimicrobial peptide transport system permease subunit
MVVIVYFLFFLFFNLQLTNQFQLQQHSSFENDKNDFVQKIFVMTMVFIGAIVFVLVFVVVILSYVFLAFLKRKRSFSFLHV